MTGDNRVLPKSTLWMNSGWFDTSEVSHKKAHWLVEVEMSYHLFFYKSIWAFLWLTSDVSNQLEFMSGVDLGKTKFQRDSPCVTVCIWGFVQDVGCRGIHLRHLRLLIVIPLFLGLLDHVVNAQAKHDHVGKAGQSDGQVDEHML